MRCKICDKEVEGKFYLHLNASHRMRRDEYLALYPEQKEEYLAQVPVVWNKGKTKETHPSVAKYAAAVKEYANRPEIRKQRSSELKDRYRNGDILDVDTRARVVAAGSQGWAKKVKEATLEERREMLRSFVTAGNEAQAVVRQSLTPEDYNRLYPFAKGYARYYNCDYCGKQIIAWFGGKPRPKKRFCNQECWSSFLEEHPFYVFKSNVTRHYSTKMGVEFCLRSKLECWMAELLDGTAAITSWCEPPFRVPYEYLGKRRNYCPDFLVNDKYLIEIKSDYVMRLQGRECVRSKLLAADSYAKERGLEFLYWQFPSINNREEFVSDSRVDNFFKTDIARETTFELN